MSLYLSPLLLAGFGSAELPGPQAIRLARKRLLAELELSATGSITAGNHSIGRQELTTLFDSLADARQLAWHIAILDDAALLAFLSDGTVTQAAWCDNPVYDDPAFKAFVSPYYAAAVNHLLQRLITGNLNPQAYLTVIDRQQFLITGDLEQCFTAATRFFHEKQTQLLVLADRIKADPGCTTVGPEDIRNWSNEQSRDLLNALPDVFFEALRRELAGELNDLCTIVGKERRALETAVAALEWAVQINITEELRQVIEGNLELVGDKLRALSGYPPRKAPKRTTSGARPVGIIIMLLISLLRIAATCNHSATQQFNYSDLPVLKVPPRDIWSTSLNHSNLYDAFYASGSALPDSTAVTTISLTKPLRNGADPYRPLWRYLDSDSPFNAASDRLGDGAQLLIKNQSGWNVIALYQRTDKKLGAAYVAPHSSYSLAGNDDGFRLSILAGKDWMADRLNTQLLVAAADGMGEHVQLQGGYHLLPSNRPALTDASEWDYQNLSGLPVIDDVLEIRDSAANSIHCQVKTAAAAN